LRACKKKVINIEINEREISESNMAQSNFFNCESMFLTSVHNIEVFN